MQKSAKRLALAAATHPFILKPNALYTFRLLRRLGHVADQSSDKVRSIGRDVHEAWAEFRQEGKR
jgi:hypothetical protein